MRFLFNTLFYKPLVNALGFIMAVLPGSNFGVAIILLTVIVNIFLLPFTHRAKHSQRKIQEIQPELERIRLKYKDKREEQMRKSLELYREHGISPFSGLFIALVQIPLFIALFHIIRSGGSFAGSDIYSFMPIIPEPNTLFLGLIDLTKASIPLALLAALLQFAQFTLIPRPQATGNAGESFASSFQQNLRFTLPLFVFASGMVLPAALALYWTTMSLFGIVHEMVVRRQVESIKRGNGERTQTTK